MLRNERFGVALLLKNASAWLRIFARRLESLSMNTHPDFEDLLRLLEEHHVEYMVVGGYAVAFHGYPRFTKDIDVFFHGTEENAARLRAALLSFGFSGDQLPISALLAEGDILNFGSEPVRVAMMNQIDGVTFEQAALNTVRGKYGGVAVWFIGREDLLRNKRATPRLKDKADVEELEHPEG